MVYGFYVDLTWSRPALHQPSDLKQGPSAPPSRQPQSPPPRRCEISQFHPYRGIRGPGEARAVCGGMSAAPAPPPPLPPGDTGALREAKETRQAGDWVRPAWERFNRWVVCIARGSSRLEPGALLGRKPDNQALFC